MLISNKHLSLPIRHLKKITNSFLKQRNVCIISFYAVMVKHLTFLFNFLTHHFGHKSSLYSRFFKNNNKFN